MSASDTTVIWRFLDGRTGHENQVLALTESLARRRSCQFHDLQMTPEFQGLRALRSSSLQLMTPAHPPHLLIGAGHSTHLPMLAAQHRFGGKTVVLMKPSLPARLFDACFVPMHDRIWLKSPSIHRTEGVLSRARGADQLLPDTGLLLLGGISRHFEWSNQLVLAEIRRLVSLPGISWTIAASRRTPTSLPALLHNLLSANASFVGILPAEQLLKKMAESAHIAVTCDSMSMIYESLSTGASVSLIRLPLRRSGRLSQELCRLVRSGRFADSDCTAGTVTRPPCPTQSESDRCAALLESLLLSTQPKPGTELTSGGNYEVDFLPCPGRGQSLSGAPA